MKLILDLSKKKYLAISLLIHLGLFCILFSKSSPKEKQETVDITIIYEDNKISRQVVEQLDRKNKIIPDKTHFLSQFNQKVQKNIQSKKRITQQATTPQTTVQKNIKKYPSLDQLKPQFNKNITQQFPQASNSNYLQKVEESDQTLLSTKEFLYYTYYNRIRKKINHSWRPKILAVLRTQLRRGRSLASYRGKVTKCIVILNEKGRLIGVQVIKKSGIIALDKNAIEAFKLAEPFPNPPNGIVQKSGKIFIRWNFILES